jgi:autotransporter-associated beta strand protein
MLRLEGANTYTGNTILKGGTVALGAAGSIANSGTVIVGDAGSSGVRLDLSAQSAYTFGTGQTLGGIGTVAGGGNFTNVTISGVLSPGNSPGLLTFDNANLVLDSTSNTLMEIAGTTLGSEYDAVVLAGGTLTYGGTLTIDFGSNLFTGGTFNLFEFKDAPFAYFDTVIATGSYYSGTFTKDISSGTGVYTLSGMGGGSQQLTFTDVVPAGESSSYYGQLVIVPEPVMLGLLGIASGVIVLAARRRAARIRQHAARQGDQAG